MAIFNSYVKSWGVDGICIIIYLYPMIIPLFSLLLCVSIFFLPIGDFVDSK